MLDKYIFIGFSFEAILDCGILCPIGIDAPSISVTRLSNLCSVFALGLFLIIFLHLSISNTLFCFALRFSSSKKLLK